jgi:hypothetical protein
VAPQPNAVPTEVIRKRNCIHPGDFPETATKLHVAPFPGEAGIPGDIWPFELRSDVCEFNVARVRPLVGARAWAREQP